MNRTEKETVVGDLSERLRSSSSLYLTDFTGLSVKNATEFRRKLRLAGVEYVVVKNTLAARAMEQASVEGLSQNLSGPTGIVFAGENPIAAAKVIKEFQKEFQKLTVKVGLLDGKTVSADEVDRLASLPGREELLGQLAGAMQGPLQGFLGMTNGLLNSFAGVLDALKEKQSTEAA